MLLSRANASSRLTAGPLAATDECAPHVESKAIDVATNDVDVDDTAVWEVKDAVSTITKGQRRQPATFGLVAKPHTPPLPRKDKSTEPSQAKLAESTLDLLLQPIRALFPPAPPTLPLAPAFELNLPLSSKQATKAGTAKSDEKPTDDEPFVIHQPASWSAKRPKLSAARSAYTYDWRLNVFGDSPVAVKGQRTKYPKSKPLLPFIEKERKRVENGKNREERIPVSLDFKTGLNSSVIQSFPNRDRSGSLTSSSNLSFVSFASTSGSVEDTEFIITPFDSDFQLAMSQGGCDIDPLPQDDIPFQRPLEPLPEGIEVSESWVSPTSAIRQSLRDMQVYDGAVFTQPEPLPARQEPMDEEREEYADSMPCTPETPRSVPSDDSDSDA